MIEVSTRNGSDRAQTCRRHEVSTESGSDRVTSEKIHEITRNKKSCQGSGNFVDRSSYMLKDNPVSFSQDS